ncbi:MAG: 30S ribosomal protein S6 [Actinobacteria bacterium]|nr:30S ribosomal protein S6 [Actinomycetota bacterium]
MALRPYEVVVIFDTTKSEDSINAVINQVLESVRSQGGNPGRVDRWGKRQLAYEVNHRSEGYYVVVEMAVDPQVVGDVGRILSLADEVLRYKVVRVPDRVAGKPRHVQRTRRAMHPGRADLGVVQD